MSSVQIVQAGAVAGSLLNGFAFFFGYVRQHFYLNGQTAEYIHMLHGTTYEAKYSPGLLTSVRFVPSYAKAKFDLESFFLSFSSTFLPLGSNMQH